MQPGSPGGEGRSRGLAVSPQVEGSPSLRWQMALYWGLPGREEDADVPEKIVRRVQEVSAVLYHLEQVRRRVGSNYCRSLGLWAGQGAGLGLVGGAWGVLGSLGGALSLKQA